VRATDVVRTVGGGSTGKSIDGAILTALEAPPDLIATHPSGTVDPMPHRANARRQRQRRARRHEPIRHPRRPKRTYWQAAGGVTAAIVALVLMLSAWSGGRPRSPLGTTPATDGQSLANEQPVPIVVARVGALSIKLPVARSAVTAIGYHASPDTVALSPEGTQANEGLLTRLFHRIVGSGNGGLNYYELSGGVGTDNGALDIGAAPKTDVYAPVSGKIVQISPYIVNGISIGNRIDLRPDDDATLIVSMTRLWPDPLLAIGKRVTAGVDRVGSVADFSKVERQKLARYTQDQGNHVTIEVFPAAISILP